VSTTEPEPEPNALDQAKHDYDEYRGLARLAAHRLIDEDSDRAARNVQVYATLALAAAARMQAEAALTSLNRAEQLTSGPDAEAAASVARWNARHDLGLARTVVSAEGRPEDDGLPVFGRHVTALTMREERLVNEAFAAGRDGFAKIEADRAEAAAERARRRDARDSARHGGQLDGGDEVGTAKEDL